MEIDLLCQAISGEDIKSLVTISGVGKKTAERICVELKDKVGNIVPVSTKNTGDDLKARESSAASDALSALVNLGYSEPVARDALAAVKERAGKEAFAAMSIEQLIKEGLGAVL
jgi:Holliday junction DNA helicase RuvA